MESRQFKPTFLSRVSSLEAREFSYSIINMSNMFMCLAFISVHASLFIIIHRVASLFDVLSIISFFFFTS